jgi:methanethiol S-methyltransferase
MLISLSLSFWLIILGLLLYGAVHSLLASLGIKALMRSWLGPRVDRWYRLVYNVFAFISLLPVFALAAVLPDSLLYRVPFPWSLIMVLFQGLAVVALAIGVLQTGAGTFLGLSQLFNAAPEAPPTLVVTGLYHWVRHPLYSAGLIFIWAAPWMSSNQLAINLGITFYILVGALFEERKLVNEFGEIYVHYRKNTPMLVPRLKIRAQHSPLIPD